MAEGWRKCPECGAPVAEYRNPLPTADLILLDPEERGVWLVERRNPPPGWALPGGFIEYGEAPESAARREGEEETSLEVTVAAFFGAYGDPGRDPRFHTITLVYVAHGRGEAAAADDAREVRFFPWDSLPEVLAFDHRRILDDFLASRRR